VSPGPTTPEARPTTPEARPTTPEAMFRVTGFEHAGPDARITMRTGDWLLDDAGVPCSGALGVFLDDAVGHQVFTTRPDDAHASVTSELSIDVALPPPWTGPELVAQGWTTSSTGRGAFTQCRVTDSDGAIVAVVSNWGRFVALPPGVPVWSPDPSTPEPDPALRVSQLLGSRPERTADGAVLRLTGGPELANPMGIVHGGIVACASERTAAATLDDPATWWAASIRVHYLRPTPLSPEVELTASVVHRGRTVTVVRVVGGPVGGRPCTDATITFRTRD
jgi:uncharacterized protein (TIGR00369 family)